MHLKHISIFLFSLILGSSIPLASQAALDLYNPRKHYGDEKTAINNPTSRCTGADFKKMYADALASAQKDFDGARKGTEGNASLTAAFETYKKDLELGWQAMEEPYCGFGAFGSTAAKKSFQKTLTRARTNFLAEVKKAPLPVSVNVTSVPTPVAVVSNPTPVVPKTPALAKSEPVKSTPVVAKASASSHFVLSQNLKRGMRNAEVLRLQNWLVANGYLEADYATGYFGEMTEAAVIKFQQERGLITSKTSNGAGLIGPRTRAEFMK